MSRRDPSTTAWPITILATVLLVILIVLSFIVYSTAAHPHAAAHHDEVCVSHDELATLEEIADRAYMEGLNEGRRGGHQEAFNEGKKWGYREACIRCCEFEGPDVVASFDSVTGGCLCASPPASEAK